MNPGVYSVQNNRVVIVGMVLLIIGGIVAYQQMGRLEDPEFTIKEALIITPYPGASAEDVALEVTNPIENACQSLGQLRRVESESTRGRSVVKAVIRDRYDRKRIPQVWDELRRALTMYRPSYLRRSAGSQSWSTTSATYTASFWPSRVRDSRIRSSDGMPSFSVAS